jgi:hypothetical protein
VLRDTHTTFVLKKKTLKSRRFLRNGHFEKKERELKIEKKET